MATLTDTARRPPFDSVLLLVAPAAMFMLLVFIYPFLYGLALSFEPKEGGVLANYVQFFTTDNLWPTIGVTLKLALPATLFNVGLALPIAFKMRVLGSESPVATTASASAVSSVVTRSPTARPTVATAAASAATVAEAATG